jgi:hypothetical protein
MSGRTACSNMCGRIACFQSQVKEQLALKHGLNSVFSSMSGRTACSQTWVEQRFLKHLRKNLFCLNRQYKHIKQKLISKISNLCSELARLAKEFLTVQMSMQNTSIILYYTALLRGESSLLYIV